MLVAAAFWRPDRPSGSVTDMLSQPQLAHYVAGWPRPGDLGVIAVDGQQPVGAAWVRLLPESDPGYGFVDATTQELSMGVTWAWRWRGIGSRLLGELIAAAREQGVASLSLSGAGQLRTAPLRAPGLPAGRRDERLPDHAPATPTSELIIGLAGLPATDLLAVQTGYVTWSVPSAADSSGSPTGSGPRRCAGRGGCSGARTLSPTSCRLPTARSWCCGVSPPVTRGAA